MTDTTAGAPGALNKTAGVAAMSSLADRLLAVTPRAPVLELTRAAQPAALAAAHASARDQLVQRIGHNPSEGNRDQLRAPRDHRQPNSEHHHETDQAPPHI